VEGWTDTAITLTKYCNMLNIKQMYCRLLSLLLDWNYCDSNLMFGKCFFNIFHILEYKGIYCWVRLLSNYNIKYISTIYIRLDTCHMYISRFSLRDKVALRLFKLHFGVDVVEWSRALDIRLSDWCCSVSMVWVQIPSKEGQKFDSSKI
jgi:hypothetical protein